MVRIEHDSPLRLFGTRARFLLLVPVVLVLSTSGTARAQVTTEHPFIKPQDIEAGTCLICHPDKREGKYVHSAVAAGCQNCHQITSKNDETTIVLLATDGELCRRCHEARSDPFLHAPYKDGQCMVCHNPHTSNFPRQLRAETNTLCLSCHGANQPDVRIDTEAQKVSLPGGQTVAFAEYREAPKISLDPSGTRGHPIAGHPVAGEDPFHKGATLTCLSCHAPHSSTFENLLPANVKSSEQLCTECHQKGGPSETE